MGKIDRKQKAYEIFLKGYGCCSSVVAAFEDILPFNQKELINIGAAFGGGFARTRNMCGALSAVGIVVGLYNKNIDFNPEDKGDLYQKIGKLYEKFVSINGSAVCGELLKNVKNITKGYIPQVRDEEYYKSRPCLKFVLDSVDLIEKYLDLN